MKMEIKKAIRLLQAVCKSGLDNGNMYGFFKVEKGVAMATDTRRAIRLEAAIPGAEAEGFYVWQRNLAVKINAPEKFPNFDAIFNHVFDTEIFNFAVPQLKSKERQYMSIPNLSLKPGDGCVGIDCNLVLGIEHADTIRTGGMACPVQFESEPVQLLVMPMTF